MDEFIKTIKNKLSMENIIELLKEDNLEEKDKAQGTLEKVEPGQISNVGDLTQKLKEEQSKPSLPQVERLEDLQKNSQKKEPSAKNSLNVLQKPVEPEEIRDPFRDDENLFNFYD